MRLLNIHTLELEEYFTETLVESKIKYGILSHTWEAGQELSFQDWMFLIDYPGSEKAGRLREKSGYKKIAEFAAMVRKRGGCDYVWVDTIGINKESSAELSEAINSMYKWYQIANICYVILADVPSTDDIYAAGSQFRNSRWFTRGWTLQELLAPETVLFYFAGWEYCASRKDLVALLRQVTGVPFRSNGCSSLMHKYSIAQRISWASSRKTTRTEDAAYCLLGILEVNMPLLYGEGPKAFKRLQRMLILQSCDQSILAWGFNDADLAGEIESDFSAKSAANFNESAGVLALDQLQMAVIAHSNKNYLLLTNLELRHPFECTNIGLRITLFTFTRRELGLCNHVGQSCAQAHRKPEEPRDFALLQAGMIEGGGYDGGENEPKLLVMRLFSHVNGNESQIPLQIRVGNLLTVPLTVVADVLRLRPRPPEQYYLEWRS